MANNSGFWRRILVTLVIAVAVAGVGAGLALVLRTRGLQEAAAWAQLLSLGVAVVPLFSLRSATRVPADPADRTTRAMEVLANAVRRQWRDEIVVRQLDNPDPLAVRWRRTDLAGEPEPRRFALRQRRQRSEWRADQVDRLAAEFHSLDRQRLVILGEPGMGKTTLAMLLLRELANDRQPDEPVPVLLTLAGWHPAAESLDEWLARQLITNYPALGAAEFGPDMPTTLVTDRRIVPMLDGLDELPEELRPEVLTALNATLTKDDPLVLTCRTAEYAAAVRRGGQVADAAVLEPQPLATREVLQYLRECLRRYPGGESWDGVLATIADDADSPIACALTTPLDLWLVRKIYVEPRADPAELDDRDRFPTPAAITRHLLGHLTDALVAVNPPKPRAGDHVFRPRRDWDSADAERWLTFLAEHLHTTGERDLAWWRLHRAVSLDARYRTVIGLVLGLVLGPLPGLIGGLVGWFAGQPLAGLLAGLLGGLGAALAYALAAAHDAAPAHADFRLRGRGRQLLRELVFPLVMWLSSALVIGLLFQLLELAGLLGFLLTGLVFGLLHGLMVWIASPVSDERAQSPVESLRGDLRLTIARAGAFAVAGGLAVGIIGGLVGYLVLVPVAVLVVLIAVLQDKDSPPRWACLVYFATVVILWMQGRIPLRLMGFLDDAHRLNLLRQAGTVYQFRHAKYQDHLAATAQRQAGS